MFVFVSFFQYKDREMYAFGPHFFKYLRRGEKYGRFCSFQQDGNSKFNFWPHNREESEIMIKVYTIFEN